MAAWWICVLLFASLSETSLQENLRGYSLIFSRKGYVSLEVDQPRELLQNITICLCSFSDSQSKQALFSYATKDQDKEILIYKARGVDGFWWYTVYIGGTAEYFRVPDSYLDWQRICITWASETGVLSLSMDRNLLARKVVQPGYFIKPHALVQLGRAHHEDIFFHGEIHQVHMWNYTVNILLYPSEMPYLSSMISWNNMNYTTHGNVAVDYILSSPQSCPF
ncbi:mucosal pentraxin-like [Candoia aspera]|uniref:mucosal pentraxin-like n=1 Tax=Candoia aspera TaxID=51853 RepID=UPI002FD7C153